MGSSIREIKADGTVTCETDDEGAGGTSLWTESGSDVYRSSGNVGIGKTTPSAKLDVKTSTSNLNSGYFKNDSASISAGLVTDAGTSTSGYSFWARDKDQDTLMKILGNGNIGVGIDSPSYKLDVAGDINFTGTLYQNGSAFGGGGSSLWTESGSDVYRSSGNVGIGTTSPSTGGGYNRTLNIHSTDTAGLVFSDNTKEYSVGLNAQDSLDFYDVTNGAHRILIDTNGNVGIGTTSPGGKLHVAGADNDNRVHITGDGIEANLWNGGAFNISTETTNDIHFYPGKNQYSLHLASNGNVGIGTKSPAGKLDVNGAIYQRGSSLHADYVFEDNYNIESIEDHADFMWTNKHLKGVPGVQHDDKGQEVLEIGAHRKGILEELEKAHVYIEQLNNENKELKNTLKTVLSRLDALENK